MSLSALGAGLSGMNANQKALAFEANNVANLATENFKAQEAAFEEASPGGTGVKLSAEGRQLAAAEGTDLARSITNSLMYKLGFELSAKVVQAADERLGTLIDVSA